MVNRIFFFILVFSSGVPLGSAQSSAYLEYIELYKPVAIAEMERTGVPASIKMAQAILESNAGRSDLARKANNHFGIKCSSNWDGKTFKKVDDDRDRRGRLIKSCFRSYGSALESFRAHSEFLRAGDRQGRYAFLFELDVKDYKGWAKGLKRAGYATSPTYHHKLIHLIERYELYRLDEMTAEGLIVENEEPVAKEQEKPDPGEIILFPEPGSTPVPPTTREERLITNIDYHNDVRNIVANRDEILAQLAKVADVDLDRLLRYNENLHSGNQIVPAGTRVYMQPKRKNFRGRKSWHKVKKGETMMDISIAYGIRLEHLYERNRLQPGREPVTGSTIKLRGGDVDNPPVTFNPDNKEQEEAPGEIVVENETPVLDIEVVGNSEAAEEEGVAVRPNDIFEDPFGPSPVSSGSEKEHAGDEKAEEDPLFLPSITPERPVSEKEEPVPPAPAEEDIITDPEIEIPGSIQEDPFGTSSSKNREGTTYYVVQQGDTLWSISRRYNTTVDEVKQLNNLDDDYIRRGMRLRVK